MTLALEEAIEILAQHQKGTDPLYLPKLAEAEALGIEALKVFAEYRYATDTDVLELLPGETEE